MTDRIDDVPLDDDLAAKFARLDQISAPDNWNRSAALAEAPASQRYSTQRRWVAAAAAVLVLGGVVALVATRGGDASLDVAEPGVTPETPRSDPADSAPPATEADGRIDRSKFGAATVNPSRAAPGDRVSVTPNNVIKPTCLDLGAIYRVDGDEPLRLGILRPDGTWTPGSELTGIRLCSPLESAEAESYVIPHGLPVGLVSVCRAVGFSNDACGPLEIVGVGSDDAVLVKVPVVEGLIEGEAVNILRTVGLTVEVERREVGVGDPNHGRVMSQSPAAASRVDVNEAVSIIVGQATHGADLGNDVIGRTLREFGVDVEAAPLQVRSLDGATFCGSEQTGLDGFRSDAANVEGRRCLLDHHAARLPSVFVSGSSTDEGDPIVVVTRTEADGTASQFVDSTRDAFGSGEWEVLGCGLPTGNADFPTAFGCLDRVDALTEPIAIGPLPFPPWFADRTSATTCGYFSATLDVESAIDPREANPLTCMADAVDDGEVAELVTVHVGDDLRVARWIVSIGPGPVGTPQFEVASLAVDLREGTTRWAETRCVEGYLVEGRLVGDFQADRDLLDQVAPAGTTVTASGEVVIEPGPDARINLQACNGPRRVDRPFVTPFEATGQRIGEVGPRATRFPGSNEVGEYDVTIVRSWDPFAVVDSPAIVGFVPSDSLEFPPAPGSGEPDGFDRTLYADDGVTRVGELGPDGSAVLD